MRIYGENYSYILSGNFPLLQNLQNCELALFIGFLGYNPDSVVRWCNKLTLKC